MLPPFTSDGLLPAGDYALTLGQLRGSLLVVGPDGGYPDWDAIWRGKLVDNLAILVGHLHGVGVDEIFIDGSFTEDKDHPNDIDGYFVCDENELRTGILEYKLNNISGGKGIWTWDPRNFKRTNKGIPKLPMWHRYSVEFFPHCGQSSGILDEHGNPQTFPAAFRKQRHTWKPKGIIRIVKSTGASP